MVEEWRNIEGYDNYMVSNLGRIKSLRFGKEKILKLKVQNNGYNVISLYKERNRKFLLLHRLVAQAFLPNHNNLPFVDHIDTNPSI